MSFPAHAKAPVRLAYAANRQGEIDPCGCQVHQTGGINRVQALLEDEKKAHPNEPPALFLDAGDTFFAATTLNPSRKPGDLLRAKIIAEAYRKLGVAAVTPGERDFADGADTLQQLAAISGATFLAANLRDEKGKPLLEPYRLFEQGDAKVAVVGLVDEVAFAKVTGVKAESAVATWKELLPKIREVKPDVVVVLSHLGLAKDRELAEIGGMNLIFGAHSLDVLTEPVKVGKVSIFQPQNEGAQLGLVDYQPDDFSKSTHRLIDLGKELDRQNEVAQLMKKYKEQARQLAVESSARVETRSGKPFVANALTCRNCHVKQYEFWETTKHASAYLVLYAKNQHFDQQCIGCHSLGFEQPEGFQSVAHPIELEPKEIRKKGSTPFIETLMKKIFTGDPKSGPLDSRLDPDRFAVLKKRYHSEIRKLEQEGKIAKLYIGVQCEHCHGNRNGHPDPRVATIKKVSEKTCRTCHQPPNAPGFDPAMIAKIACPLSPRNH